jgi:hypothetical protein
MLMKNPDMIKTAIGAKVGGPLAMPRLVGGP